MSSTTPTDNSYRADIDGLRAVAVSTVALYHAELAFPGGFTGVDVFFVISGYLIISILHSQMSQGTFTFLGFWERRVRRLVPALFVSSLATATLSYLVLLPDDLVGSGGALVALPLLLVNVFIWRRVRTGYFGHAPETRPLLHTWSLGLEEQFYLIFPLMLYLLLRFKITRDHLLKILTGIVFLSLFLCIKLTPDKAGFAFFCLPTRAWEFLAGGLAALLPVPFQGTLHASALGCLGLGLIGASLYGIDEQTAFPGAAALLPVIGTALILWVRSGPTTVLTRLLSFGPLVLVGKISYSVYLWHWPLIAIAKYVNCLRTLPQKLLVVGLSYLFGYLSWKFVEQPFRNRRWLSERRHLFGAFFAQGAVLVLIGAAFIVTSGYVGRFSPKSQQLAEAAERYQAFDVKTRMVQGNVAMPKDIGLRPPGPPKFLLWGDSHAMSLSRSFDDLGLKYGVSGYQLTAGSTPPLADWGYSEENLRFATPAYKALWVQSALKAVEDPHIRTVFLVSYWSYYSQSSLPSEILALVKRLQERKLRVVLVGDVPSQSFHVPRMLALHEHLNVDIPELTTSAEHQKRSWAIYQTVDSLKNWPNFQFIDLSVPALQWKSLADGSDALYMDTNHLAYPGAKKVQSLFEAEFERLRSDSPREQP